jgi:fatty-acyl-CoA synthase
MGITGGTRVPPAVLTTWRDKGVLLRQMYGLTEVGNYCTMGSEREVRENRQSCGRQMIFTQLKIVRPDGTQCDVGEAGEIRAKGPGMMVGYWKNPEATAAAFEDGWLKTGDRGFLDAEGYLTFVDRQKDMIITGGFNVSPSEVENVIADFGGIDEVAVIPVPDAKFGETPAACIHAAAPVDAQALFAHCKGRLAGFKLPRYIIASDDRLPRNSNAKIDKKLLVARYADAPERFERMG